jgi:hypothetical protein
MRTFRLALVACVAAGALACSQSNRGSVTGTVTYHGQTVKAGAVHFVYEQGGQYLSGIKSDGSYEFMDVPTGNVKVLVDTETFNPEQRPQSYTQKQQQMSKGYGKEMQEYNKMMGRGGKDKQGDAPGQPLSKEKKEALAKVYVKIPRKYAGEKTTPLTYTVGSGRQTRDLDLTD